MEPEEQREHRHPLSYPLVYTILGFAIALILFLAVLLFYREQADTSGVPLTLDSFFDHAITMWAAFFLVFLPLVFRQFSAPFIDHFSTLDSRITISEFFAKRDAYRSKADPSDEDFA